MLHGRIIRLCNTVAVRLQSCCITGDIFHPCCDRVLRPYSPAIQCLCCGGNCWMNQNGDANRRRQLLLLIPLLLLIRRRRKMSNRCCWIRNWIARRRCLGMSHTLVKELTVEDGGDFRSMFRIDIETIENLLSMVMPYIEKEDSHLWPCVTAHERLHITVRYLATGQWRHVLLTINTARVVRRQNTNLYAARIVTVLTKKHNMSSFFEDFRQKISRTRFQYTQPCDVRTTRTYYLAVQNGHHTGR